MIHIDIFIFILTKKVQGCKAKLSCKFFFVIFVTNLKFWCELFHTSNKRIYKNYIKLNCDIKEKIISKQFPLKLIWKEIDSCEIHCKDITSLLVFLNKMLKITITCPNGIKIKSQKNESPVISIYS